eukprot:g13857.t1
MVAMLPCFCLQRVSFSAPSSCAVAPCLVSLACVGPPCSDLPRPPVRACPVPRQLLLAPLPATLSACCHGRAVCCGTARMRDDDDPNRMPKDFQEFMRRKDAGLCTRCGRDSASGDLLCPPCRTIFDRQLFTLGSATVFLIGLAAALLREAMDIRATPRLA